MHKIRTHHSVVWIYIKDHLKTRASYIHTHALPDSNVGRTNANPPSLLSSWRQPNAGLTHATVWAMCYESFVFQMSSLINVIKYIKMSIFCIGEIDMNCRYKDSRHDDPRSPSTAAAALSASSDHTAASAIPATALFPCIHGIWQAEPDMIGSTDSYFVGDCARRNDILAKFCKEVSQPLYVAIWQWPL